jgi:hypothetical protein
VPPVANSRPIAAEPATITTWIFGGWAEESRGVCVSRLHNDVDLLFPAEDFGRLDALIRQHALDEIELKRRAHKRAIVLAGVMTDIFLVRYDERGAYTNLWGRTRHDWPNAVFGHLAGRRVASVAALQSYRGAQSRLHAFPLVESTLRRRLVCLARHLPVLGHRGFDAGSS